MDADVHGLYIGYPMFIYSCQEIPMDIHGQHIIVFVVWGGSGLGGSVNKNELLCSLSYILLVTCME